MNHPGGAIFTHTADTEYGGVLRIRLYDRATIKRGCSTTRVVPVGVTFARRGDEKEREWRNGEKREKGRERERRDTYPGTATNNFIIFKMLRHRWKILKVLFRKDSGQYRRENIWWWCVAAGSNRWNFYLCSYIAVTRAIKMSLLIHE